LQGKGWRIPVALFPPTIMPGTEGWLDDFFELGTDRAMGMNSPGPIPSASISRHVENWPEDEADTFRFVIRQLDQAYLGHLRPDGDVPVSDNPARDAFRALMR
jgi:hypothetical protein